MGHSLQFKLFMSALVLTLIPIRSSAGAAVFSPEILVLQAVVMGVVAIQKEDPDPTHLFTVTHDPSTDQTQVGIDLNGFKRQSRFIERYLPAIVRDWDKSPYFSEADLNIVQNTLAELLEIKGANEVFGPEADPDNLALSILFLGMKDYVTKTSRRHPKPLMPSTEFENYINWLSSKNPRALEKYHIVRTWTRTRGLPYLL